MKTAIYIENGLTQFVLTPENEFERGVVKSITEVGSDTQILHGAFYACQGGWTRHATGSESLMIRVTLKGQQPPDTAP